MTFHIARGDQKFGPFSLAETQERLNAGMLLPSDLAWWQGQPGWVPLPQIPGLVAAATGRPVLVWVICGIYLALILWGLGASLWFFFHFPPPSSPNSSPIHLNHSAFAVSAVLQLVKLAGVALLFKLRRSALYVLGGVFGISLSLTIYQTGGLLLHASYSPFFVVEMVFIVALNLVILAYVWHLFLKGVLR